MHAATVSAGSTSAPGRAGAAHLHSWPVCASTSCESFTRMGLVPPPVGHDVSMTKVLIAADSSESSLAAARGAVALFGDTAEYLVVNVDRALNDAMAWGAAYPMAL